MEPSDRLLTVSCSYRLCNWHRLRHIGDY